MTERNHGVDILIQRLKSNPEDFDYGGKFHHFAETLSEIAGGSERLRRTTDPIRPLYFLSEEDRTALVEAWKEYMRGQFATDIMRTLMEEEKLGEKVAKVTKVQKKQPQYSEDWKRQQLQQEQMIAMERMRHEQMMAEAYNRAYNSQQQSASNIGGALTGNGLFKGIF